MMTMNQTWWTKLSINKSYVYFIGFNYPIQVQEKGIHFDNRKEKKNRDKNKESWYANSNSVRKNDTLCE